MCGITGWVDWDKDLTNSQDVLFQMTQTLVSRGPDAAGYFLEHHVGFGHRRLIVIDPAGGGQPMMFKQGEHSYVLVYNGELYNTQELRAELIACGYQFHGYSDTETLLLSYVKWGPACLEKLNGIFAFAIWDGLRRQIFLARDRLGVKPLFYARTTHGLIFASEIKALLKHPELRSVVGRDGLAEIFLLGPARSPGQAVYQDIQELKAGHQLIYKPEGLICNPYWSLPNSPHTDNLEETIRRVRELFQDSVKRQLISDVPIGTLLSGGLDSSAITALAVREKLGWSGVLPTFSVDYLANNIHFHPNDFQPQADTPWAERVSQHFHTNHHVFWLDTPQLVESLQEAMLARDFPGMTDIDSSLLLFAREIKKHVTVALSGECADEIFGGYPWFHRPSALGASTFPWAVNTERRLALLSPELLEFIQPQKYLDQRYQEALAEVPRLSQDNWSSSKLALENRLREISYLTLTRFMPTLLERKDRMTMACGLEVRVPFCDHRLVEYVWGIPWELKNLQGREKGLLRHALAGILPDDVLWRRKSPYPKTHNPDYLAAVSSWLEQILADPNSPLLPLINVSAVKKLLHASSSTVAGNPWFGQLMDTTQLLAYLLQINLWLEHNHVTIC